VKSIAGFIIAILGLLAIAWAVKTKLGTSASGTTNTTGVSNPITPSTTAGNATPVTSIPQIPLTSQTSLMNVPSLQQFESAFGMNTNAGYGQLTNPFSYSQTSPNSYNVSGPNGSNVFNLNGILAPYLNPSGSGTSVINVPDYSIPNVPIFGGIDSIPAVTSIPQISFDPSVGLPTGDY
jgi:hypothetical protein